MLKRRREALRPLSASPVHCFDFPPFRPLAASAAPRSPRRWVAVLTRHAMERAKKRGITQQELMGCLWLGKNMSPPSHDTRLLYFSETSAAVMSLSLTEAVAWATPEKLDTHGLDAEEQALLHRQLTTAEDLQLDFTLYIVVTVFNKADPNHVAPGQPAPRAAPVVYRTARR